MGGYQTTHVVADSPIGPFAGTAIAAPAAHYNPHAYHFDDGSKTGLYVLYTNGGPLAAAGAAAAGVGSAAWNQQQRQQAPTPPVPTCTGEEQNHTHTALPFLMPSGNCTTGLCAIYSTSLSGPWKQRSVASGCIANAVPYQLRNGSILLASTCGSIATSPSLPGRDSEAIQLLIAKPGDFFGPFEAVAGHGFGGLLWSEEEPGEGRHTKTHTSRRTHNDARDKAHNRHKRTHNDAHTNDKVHW